MTARCVIDVELSLTVTAPGGLAVSVAVAGGAGTDREELRVEGPAAEAGNPARLVDFPHGTRVHVLDLGRGELTIGYRAERSYPAVAPEPLGEADLVTYTRPSRYCPSDRLGGFANREFGGLPDARARVEAIVSWVGERVEYLPGASRPTDDAVNTLLAGEGVCRDFAHLCVAFCRALDIPARFVAVYAPGLSPMDFHAVFEAAIDGHWWLFDATGLAPRPSMTRIATGRDAADTAFLSTLGCEMDFGGTRFTVFAEPGLPADDRIELVALA
ncbi:transglutaminase-like domain-containing protein [Amycolatopsis anabasis]|uniref:transglutaminase-like domain-containing protein n=1 Tax=Amycolatopsis anabasis TaxID=1840409 RepID=UPI00131D6A2E|nr:transglutaminase family protein [Amycolatopsis anabasis]